MPMINQKHLGLSEDHNPIISLCTPRGNGAIALIRLSGDGAVAILDNVVRLSSKKKLNDASSHTIHHGYVVDNAAIIDECLFFLMLAPKTFTGQDTVEISCHNNQFIIESIIALAIQYGARLAKPGEFTQRAFLNGKIDLIQAEAVNEIVHAQTEIALRRSFEQLQGSLSHNLHKIERLLISLLSLVETSFEFLDEEQRDLNIEHDFRRQCISLLEDVRVMKSGYSQQQQVRQGVRVAILGVVNAGKSTLFNALVKKDRAIVTSIAGTTRDSIELSVYRGGIFITFVDTAGLRTTNDEIEQQGIERSLGEAQASDIILLVFDASVFLSQEIQKVYQDLMHQFKDKILIVFNKIDQQDSLLLKKFTELFVGNFIKVSAKNVTGIDDLELKINEKVQELFLQLKSPFLLNQRQYRLLEEIERKLDFIVKNSVDVLHYELIAYHLKEILEKVSELTGHNVTEQILDTVFNDFCVGK